MHPTLFTIRAATARDEHALSRLAVLDSQRALRAPALIAEIAGRPAAAIGLKGGVIADPFQPTASIVRALWRLGAATLCGPPPHGQAAPLDSGDGEVNRPRPYGRRRDADTLVCGAATYRPSRRRPSPKLAQREDHRRKVLRIVEVQRPSARAPGAGGGRACWGGCGGAWRPAGDRGRARRRLRRSASRSPRDRPSCQAERADARARAGRWRRAARARAAGRAPGRAAGRHPIVRGAARCRCRSGRRRGCRTARRAAPRRRPPRPRRPAACRRAAHRPSWRAAPRARRRDRPRSARARRPPRAARPPRARGRARPRRDRRRERDEVAAEREAQALGGLGWAAPSASPRSSALSSARRLAPAPTRGARAPPCTPPSTVPETWSR